MATMFTRTITTFKATAYKMELDKETMTANVTELGTALFVSTNGSKTEARAALKSAGVDCPRGCEVTWEAVESTLYAMPIDKFMSLAEPIKTEKGLVKLD